MRFLRIGVTTLLVVFAGLFIASPASAASRSTSADIGCAPPQNGIFAFNAWGSGYTANAVLVVTFLRSANSPTHRTTDNSNNVTTTFNGIWVAPTHYDSGMGGPGYDEELTVIVKYKSNGVQTAEIAKEIPYTDCGTNDIRTPVSTQRQPLMQRSFALAH